MHSASYATAVPRATVRAGAIITALPVLFLLFDSAIKLARIQPVLDAFGQLGWPVHLAWFIGALQVFCLALYLVPFVLVGLLWTRRLVRRRKVVAAADGQTGSPVPR